MSDDDDTDFTSTNRSSRNLASLFQGVEPPTTAPVATTAYVPPKQPKKDSPPKVMIASVIQAFSFGADQKWASRGKMGVALLSTENTIFQLILYVTKTQHVTSARVNTSSVFTSQANNYLSFQDDGGQNWSIMFDSKQAIIDFVLQIVLAKAYLLSFKFDHLTQEIREGEGAILVDHDSVEITVHIYKLLENGTLSLTSTDNGENKPVRLKIGKQQNGKTFDETLKGMKKNSHRITMIGTVLYSIEVIRIKREKDARSSSITVPTEEPIVNERKATITEDNENSNEKNKMLQRINKMGGVSMLSNQTSNSAFVTPLPPHLTSLSDDDSINNEFISNIGPPRSIPTSAPPPVQFVPPTYHQPHQPPHPYPPSQPLIQQTHLYSTQQPIHDYNSRPGSSMGPTSYSQVPTWSSSPYLQSTLNVPTPDMFYQQQTLPTDFRQFFHRLTEKVDLLTDKIDTKNSTIYPNMETSILLANIQRIVKENDTMKKDLFDRSAKVEEQNQKISDLLDKNQRLIEQSHLTAEQRNVVVNNVSEQTATKILELEKQKVELTNNLSVSTSKIADLQLQNNQLTQDNNESHSRISLLTHKCEQYREQSDKADGQRLEIQMKFDSFQEQFKNEKLMKKQLQNNFNVLEEELAEMKVTFNTFEKTNSERKLKHDNERKRWQDEMDEQKQSYEKELDELRSKLRKQRTADSLTNNQEINRIEQDLAREWQEKFERQQTQHERLLSSKGKEFEQLKILFAENETKLEETTEELNHSKQEIEAYEERCEKLQERLLLMKEKLIEITDDQAQAINDEVKRVINLIFQRLKTRIRATKRYTGDEFLSRSLEIIKRATIKVLSNTDEQDQSSTDEIQSNDENELSPATKEVYQQDQPINGNSIDQKTLTEVVSSIPLNQNEQIDSNQTETTPENNQKNGWDTVDDLQQETKIPTETLEQSHVVLVTEDISSSVQENETNPSNPVIENQELPSSNIVQDEEKNDVTGDTIEENEKAFPPQVELPKSESSTDDEDNDESFQSARPSSQTPSTTTTTVPRYTFNQNIPLLTNHDDGSDDELFK